MKKRKHESRTEEAYEKDDEVYKDGYVMVNCNLPNRADQRKIPEVMVPMLVETRKIDL